LIKFFSKFKMKKQEGSFKTQRPSGNRLPSFTAQES